MIPADLIQQGLLIDPDDVDLLSQYQWYIYKGGYIRANADDNGKSITLLLHRLILNADEKEIVDHINKNPLDNRKINLRLVSRRTNRLNTDKTVGVRQTTSGKWQARICGKALGSFDDKETAIAFRKQHILENE